MTSEARAEAVNRLDLAQAEEDRLGSVFRTAVGTSREFGAYARFQSGRRDVAARQKWLDHVTDDEAASAVALKLATIAHDTDDDAFERLETALVEQTRSGGRYRSALSTTNELGAYVRPQEASDEVAARETWPDEIQADASAQEPLP
jgi:hypothetical protein